MSAATVTQSKKVVVLISGNGSNLQSILDASGGNYLPHTKVSLVVSNKKDAYGLKRAENANVPTLYFPLKPYTSAGKTREEYDEDLAKEIKNLVPDIDLVVLAGWMHILSWVFIQLYFL